MTLINLFRTALRGVISNKLRAALTTLGIVIGVASVIAMLALGNGAKAAVASAFQSLGADEVDLYEKKAMSNGQFEPVGKILSYEDGLNLPHEVDLVDRVDIGMAGSGRVRFGRNTLDMNYSGVTADALRTLLASGEVQPVNWPAGKPIHPENFIAEGRFFTSAEVLEGADVCVIGSNIARDLFTGDNALGETVWVNRKPCQVIGVIAELEPIDPKQKYNNSYNDLFLLPISKAIREFYKEEPSVEIKAYVKDVNQIGKAKEQIQAYLRQRHAIEKDADGEYQDDFSMTTRSDILGAQEEAARTFSLLLAAMATVSLVVGGIGIMNVMLVSVTERTREIGIRLAIGAQQRDIILQFLLEAIVISAIGGVLGIVVGILSIPLAASLNNGMALLAPDSIPLAFSVALITGIAFGLYPAIHAARLHPIDALRHE
jgi:putative ABC transport system permease protein